MRHRTIYRDEWQHSVDVPVSEEFYFFAVIANKEHVFAVSIRGHNKTAIVRVNLIDYIEKVLIADLVQGHCRAVDIAVL